MKNLILTFATILTIGFMSSCTKEEIQSQCSNVLCSTTFRFDSVSISGQPFIKVNEPRTYEFTNELYGSQPDVYKLVATTILNGHQETYEWKLVSDSANVIVVNIRNDEQPTITILDPINATLQGRNGIYKLTRIN